MAEALSGVFIDVEVDASVAGDAELAKKLEEVCPVDIFEAGDSGVEIVAENDLFATNEDTKTFRVLYRGEPLAGVLVAAMRPGTTDTDVTARTDSSGRVQFSLRKSGAWRIAAVHMVTPPADVDADWDSLWASLTFELADSSASPHRDARCQNQVAATALQAQR